MTANLNQVFARVTGRSSMHAQQDLVDKGGSIHHLAEMLHAR